APVLPTVHSAVSPATWPRRPAPPSCFASAMLVSHNFCFFEFWLSVFFLSEQLVQLLLEVVVVQEIVELHAGLHKVNYVFLVALVQDVLVHRQCSFVH